MGFQINQQDALALLKFHAELAALLMSPEQGDAPPPQLPADLMPSADQTSKENGHVADHTPTLQP